MGKKLAIKGHATRGNEVIELLEMLGGINDREYSGTNTWKDEYYFLDNGYIRAYDWCDGIKFSLEEFLEKYPFKVYDKVFDTADGDPGIIADMKWDEDVSDIKYHIAFDNGDMGWFTIDTFGFLKKDKNREYDELRMPLDDDDKLATEVTIMGKRILPPDGYLVGKITQTDNGMLVEYVNKKPVFPKTYAECCRVLGISDGEFMFTGLLDDEYDLFNYFVMLRRCRNAYWKIAGKEMGLGKPWEPDWNNIEIEKYCIFVGLGNIYCDELSSRKCLFAFPTEEMRDVFYENFKELIEQCKELL